MRSAPWRSATSRLTSEVLPAPRNPETTVIGIGASTSSASVIVVISCGT
ncbi:MAG: hypothetical protein M3417_09030 [Actinomycetota bacterium]|nr:hypothetical protein [Actinomycetota bacterium]